MKEKIEEYIIMLKEYLEMSYEDITEYSKFNKISNKEISWTLGNVAGIKKVIEELKEILIEK